MAVMKYNPIVIYRQIISINYILGGNSYVKLVTLLA